MLYDEDPEFLLWILIPSTELDTDKQIQLLWGTEWEFQVTLHMVSVTLTYPCSSALRSANSDQILTLSKFWGFILSFSRREEKLFQILLFERTLLHHACVHLSEMFILNIVTFLCVSGSAFLFGVLQVKANCFPWLSSSPNDTNLKA